MYAILAEDKSDVGTLKVLAKRIANNEHLTVKGKGYGGCGEMLRKGRTDLLAYDRLGFERFIICHDSDGVEPRERWDLVYQKIVVPSGLDAGCCIVVPVEELEAWILADIEAVTNVFTSWRPKPIDNPEAVRDPKEHLERLSKSGTVRPRYSHAIHNEHVAKYLKLEVIRAKCKSFRPFYDFMSRAS